MDTEYLSRFAAVPELVAVFTSSGYKRLAEASVLAVGSVLDTERTSETFRGWTGNGGRAVRADAPRIHRGRQSADICLRVRAFREPVEAELEQLRQSALAQEFLDIDRMNRVLQRTRTEATAELNSAVVCILLHGLAVGIFLRRLTDC